MATAAAGTAPHWTDFYYPTGKQKVPGTKPPAYQDVWRAELCLGTSKLRVPELADWFASDPQGYPIFQHGETLSGPVDEIWSYDDESGVWRPDAYFTQMAVRRLMPVLHPVWRRSILGELRTAVLKFGSYRFDIQIGSEINVRNGMLDWREDSSAGAVLASHHPSYRSTVQLPVEYRPNDLCPKWLAHLDKVLPDPAAQSVLQEFFGAAIVPGKLPQQALFLFGKTGGNGKSVILKVLENLIGNENVSNVALQDLDTSRNRFKAKELDGKLANICADISDEQLANSDLWKNLVGGDTVNVEGKGTQSYSMRPTALLVFSCNRLPPLRDTSNAMWRRVCIIDFGIAIPESERVANFEQQLFDETPGILNWALAGARRLDSHEWHIEDDDPSGVKRAWQDMSDPAAAAVRLLLKPMRKGRVDQKELFEAIEEWAETKGATVRPKNRAAALEAAGYLPDKSNGVRLWRGCVWSDEGMSFRGLEPGDAHALADDEPEPECEPTAPDSGPSIEAAVQPQTTLLDTRAPGHV